MAQVIIAGWMDYAGHRDEVLRLLQRVGAATLDEAGCLDYSMSADANDDGRIRVFEHWSSPEALADHLETQHVKDFRAAITGFPRVDRRLHRVIVQDVESF